MYSNTSNKRSSINSSSNSSSSNLTPSRQCSSLTDSSENHVDHDNLCLLIKQFFYNSAHIITHHRSPNSYSTATTGGSCFQHEENHFNIKELTPQSFPDLALWESKIADTPSSSHDKELLPPLIIEAYLDLRRLNSLKQKDGEYILVVQDEQFQEHQIMKFTAAGLNNKKQKSEIVLERWLIDISFPEDDYILNLRSNNQEISLHDIYEHSCQVLQSLTKFLSTKNSITDLKSRVGLNSDGLSSLMSINYRVLEPHAKISSKGRFSLSKSLIPSHVAVSPTSNANSNFHLDKHVFDTLLTPLGDITITGSFRRDCQIYLQKASNPTVNLSQQAKTNGHTNASLPSALDGNVTSKNSINYNGNHNNSSSFSSSSFSLARRHHRLSRNLSSNSVFSSSLNKEDMTGRSRNNSSVATTPVNSFNKMATQMSASPQYYHYQQQKFPSQVQNSSCHTPLFSTGSSTPNSNFNRSNSNVSLAAILRKSQSNGFGSSSFSINNPNNNGNVIGITNKKNSSTSLNKNNGLTQLDYIYTGGASDNSKTNIDRLVPHTGKGLRYSSSFSSRERRKSSIGTPNSVSGINPGTPTNGVFFKQNYSMKVQTPLRSSFRSIGSSHSSGACEDLLCAPDHHPTINKVDLRDDEADLRDFMNLLDTSVGEGFSSLNEFKPQTKRPSILVSPKFSNNETTTFLSLGMQKENYKLHNNNSTDYISKLEKYESMRKPNSALSESLFSSFAKLEHIDHKYYNDSQALGILSPVIPVPGSIGSGDNNSYSHTASVVKANQFPLSNHREGFLFSPDGYNRSVCDGSTTDAYNNVDSLPFTKAVKQHLSQLEHLPYFSKVYGQTHNGFGNYYYSSDDRARPRSLSFVNYSSKKLHYNTLSFPVSGGSSITDTLSNPGTSPTKNPKMTSSIVSQKSLVSQPVIKMDVVNVYAKLEFGVITGLGNGDEKTDSGKYESDNSQNIHEITAQEDELIFEDY
ncbi:serine/threonine protein kinase regulatory subunit [Saccharomycopsis crataegensis]|uniref:Autophagy-related protein 13 n=1 Tax=Saccharomycopsis crataegensis TaxID=43959 RepID=A0AAV5QHY3_9ASCO|nr:serine/threonine protein kinase regulatory subunit [Saccharomycopsis crataegensis]